MKLNLLPTYVSKEGQIRSVLIGSAVMTLAAIGASLFLILSSRGELARQKERVEELRPAAERAVEVAKQADTIIASATGIDRNLKLAEAMSKHNSTYLELYREVLGYVPPFYRVTRIQATPVDDKTCNVQLTGVLGTFQQYADLMLALYRIEGAQRVSRSGFQVTDRYVPGLNLQDQIGLPIRPGEARLPSDPLARLDALVQRSGGATGAFEGAGGFGSAAPGQRGAMPGYSVVTVGVVLQTVADASGKVVKNRDIRTPNPRATIAAAAAGPQPTAPPPPGPGPRGGGNPDED